MLKGLPASGKSTWARQKAELGYKRISKDDLRQMVDNSIYSEDREKQIKEIRNNLIKNFVYR